MVIIMLENLFRSSTAKEILEDIVTSYHNILQNNLVGGEWAYSNVPSQYVEIIKEALLSYKTASIFNYNSELLIDFANFMIKEINESYTLTTS